MVDKFTKVSETEFTQEVAVAPSVSKYNLFELKERRANRAAKVIELQTEVAWLDSIIAKGTELGVKDAKEVVEVVKGVE